MNCTEVRRHWDLYHDSEGDPELHLEINGHLEGCPDCSRWFYRQNRLELLLADKLKATGAPDAVLWNQVLGKSGLRREPARRWAAWPTLMIAAVMLVAATWLLSAAWSPEGADLAHLTAECHQQLVDGRTDVDYSSRIDEEIERYLRTRVTFPVRCPPRQDAGFAVRGARICRLGSAEGAMLFGDVDEAPVSIFILPRGSLAAFPRQADILQREPTHECREGALEMVMARVDQNVVLVVGATDAAKLRRVLAAYGSYGHDHDDNGHSA